MDLKRQASAPLYEAIETFRKKRIVPFLIMSKHKKRQMIIHHLSNV